jgi:hypothetical protein
MLYIYTITTTLPWVALLCRVFHLSNSL